MKNKPPKAKAGRKDPSIRLLLKQSGEEAAPWLRRILPSHLFEMEVVNCSEELKAAIGQGGVDVVLLDLSTPSMENRRSFDAVRTLALPPPVIVCGGGEFRQTLSQYLKHGAFALITPEDDPEVILGSVKQAAQTCRLALENSRLRESLARKKRTVDILERLGEAMSSLFDIRKVLHLTLRIIRRSLDCEECILYLVDAESGELVEPRDIGSRSGSPQLHLWQGEGDDPRGLLKLAAEITLNRGHGLELSGVQSVADALGAAPRLQTGAPIRSLVTSPMAVGRQALGVIVVVNRIGTEGFGREDLEILSSVCRQTALAMAGIRSIEKEHSFQEKLVKQVELATGRLKERNLELQRRLQEKEESNRKIQAMAAEIAEKNRSLEAMIRQFRVIHEVSQTIGSELENESVIKRIISETAALLGAETVSVMLKNGDGCLKIRHAEGLSAEIIKNTRVRPGEGISGWVASEGKPMLVKDVNSLRRSSASDRTLYHSNSLLCVPLKIKGSVMGVLNVTNRTSGRTFDENDLYLLTILGNSAAVAIENARLYSALRESYFKTIKALVNAVEAKDSWTKDHSENVTNYSLKIADYLGLSEQQKDTIRYAGVLHDIGKIVISNTITDKADRLTDEEWDRIKEHPLIGQRILDPIDYLEPVKICIQTHHERCDGSGYPFGLKAHEISLETRIISVADAFDAMVHSRPYREALTMEQAIGELRRSSGTQFDPAVVDGLLRIIEAEGGEAAVEH